MTVWKQIGGWRFVAFCLCISQLFWTLGGWLFEERTLAHHVFSYLASGGAGAAWGRWCLTAASRKR